MFNRKKKRLNELAHAVAAQAVITIREYEHPMRTGWLFENDMKKLSELAHAYRDRKRRS